MFVCIACSLCVVRCLLFVAYCSLFVVRGPLLVMCCSLVVDIAYCVLISVCCLLM